MWKEAQKELYGFDTYENEHGFILYQIYEDRSCFGKLIYCKPESRGKLNALKLFVDFCKEINPTTFIGTVDMTSHNCEKNLKLYLNMGAKIESFKDAQIVFRLEPLKEIK